MDRLLIFLGLSLTTVACVPTMPSQFLETSEVLDRGRVAMSVQGGGGALAACCSNNNGNAVGYGAGEVRARVGVGANQEVGVSVFGGAGSDPVAGAVGGKLTYKIGATPWLAFIANAGGYDLMGNSASSGTTHTAALGGDLAAVVSAIIDDHNTRVYSGVRGSFVIPIFTNGSGATEALTIPIGIAITTSDVARLFIETGFVASWAQFSSSAFNGDGTQLGGYGAAGVQLTFK